MDLDPDLLRRELLLSFWKLHVLYHAATRPVVGQWMMEELREHGYSVSPGTLYPVLKAHGGERLVAWGEFREGIKGSS